MKKRDVIDQIQVYLAQELQSLKELPDLPDSRPATPRGDEIKRLMLMYKFLPVREYNGEDVICPASLVELELGSTRAFYFIVPQGGGLVTRVDGHPVQVITPNSPLGEALLGRRVGETVNITLGAKPRSYRIISQT